MLDISMYMYACMRAFMPVLTSMSTCPTSWSGVWSLQTAAETWQSRWCPWQSWDGSPCHCLQQPQTPLAKQMVKTADITVVHHIRKAIHTNKVYSCVTWGQSPVLLLVSFCIIAWKSVLRSYWDCLHFNTNAAPVAWTEPVCMYTWQCAQYPLVLMTYILHNHKW